LLADVHDAGYEELECNISQPVSIHLSRKGQWRVRYRG